MAKRARVIPNEIMMYFHCGRCLKEMPDATAPKDWARLSVGWTKKGLQVWCARHEINVVHLDFMGQKVQYAQPEGGEPQ
jgi:hypothetical protein